MQRAALVRLSPPGYQGTRSVTPPMSVQAPSQHAVPVSAPAVSAFPNGTFQPTVPSPSPLPHSQSMPQLGMMMHAAPVQATNAGPVNAGSVPMNPPVMNVVNAVPATAATMVANTPLNRGASTTMVSPPIAMPASDAIGAPTGGSVNQTLQQAIPPQQLPNWLAMMAPCVRKV